MPVYEQLTERAPDSSKTCCSPLTKGLLYATLGAASVILCGITATLWAWVCYGQHGSYSPMIIGPIILLIGLLSLVTIGCIAWRRQKKSPNRHTLVYQVELAHLNST